MFGTFREGSFGNAVDLAGDVDKDGVGDIVVGSFLANSSPGQRWAGLVSVFSSTPAGGGPACQCACPGS